MSQLPREYLDDISTQRFQENVARQNNKTSKTVTSNSDAITALQKKVDSIPAALSLGFTKGEFHTISVSSSLVGPYVISHGLGVVPLGWWIADNATGFTYPSSLIKIGTSSTTITFNITVTGSARNITFYLVA